MSYNPNDPTPNWLLARRAYEAYGKTTGGKNYLGLPMPDWTELTETIQNAWIAAAEAVRDAV